MKINSRLLGISLLTMICITSIGLSIETQHFVSGVSARIDPLNIDFNSLQDKTDAIYDVIEGNDSYLVWNYTTTSGNMAYVFKDGRVAIGSKEKLNLGTASTIWNDLKDTISMLNDVGAGISDAKIWQAWISSAIFYAPEKEIYHRFTYGFESNFDLNLFVPECTIKEAALGVSSCDGSNGVWDLGNPGQAYAIDGTEVTSCSSNYDCCNVPRADITGKIAPGKHKIVASRINAAHWMYISVITSPMPSKNFTLYSDDYKIWVNEMNKSQSMDKFYEFINVSPTQHNCANPLPGGIIGIDPISKPNVKVNVFINKTCAMTGNLKKEDFKVDENNKDTSINSVYFSGNGSGKTLDLAVVFDDTGSMQQQIDAMKSKVQSLTDQIKDTGMDVRYALVTFKDNVSVKTNWTSDPKGFQNSVKALKATLGGDVPEDSLDAIENVISMSFRPDAQKVILVITDASAHYKGDGTTYSMYTKDEVMSDLKKNGIIFIPVSPTFKSPTEAVDLRDIANEIQSMWIDMNSANFSGILENFKQIITGTYVIEYVSLDVTPSTTRTVTVVVDKPGCVMGCTSASYTTKS